MSKAVAMVIRIWGELKRRDEGMSVLEIVVAAFILFFVLTAVLGLVGTSTRMNMNAKARAALNNAVASHIEWVRSLDFEQIGMTGSSPEAVVEGTYTYTVEGFTITINNTISAGQGDTKELQITATASAAGYPTVTMSTLTAIRDAEVIIDRSQEDQNAPTLQFKSLTPTQDTIIYASQQLGGASLYIEARATALDEWTISELTYYCGAEILRDGSTVFANVAYWTPGTQSVQEAFRWDTRQVNESGVRSIRDGWRMVRVIATDSAGRQSFLDRRFYVDNYDPLPPASGPVAAVQSSTQTRLSWPVALDGTDPAWKYGLEIDGMQLDGSWVTASPEDPEEPVYIQQTTPFSMYRASVRAGSPRNLWSPWVDGEGVYVSRAQLSGQSTTSYTGLNNMRTASTEVTLTCTPPTFPVSQVSYDVFRSTDPSTMGGAPYVSGLTEPVFTEFISKKVGKFGFPDTLYYQFKANVILPGGPTITVRSNIVGPIAVEGTEDMEHYSW